MSSTSDASVPLPLLGRPAPLSAGARVRLRGRKLAALLRGRCPRCLEGRVFAGRVAMNEQCPGCGLRFGREWGYFFGAMYFSYGAAVAGIGLFLVLFSELFPTWSWTAVVTASALAWLPFVPAAFRYSRITWLYFDHVWDPR